MKRFFSRAECKTTKFSVELATQPTKEFFLAFRVFSTSPISTNSFPMETNWFLIVFHPFADNKKFFDLENPRDKKGFIVSGSGGSGRMTTPTLLCISFFHLIFPLENKKSKQAAQKRWKRKNNRIIKRRTDLYLILKCGAAKTTLLELSFCAIICAVEWLRRGLETLFSFDDATHLFE